MSTEKAACIMQAQVSEVGISPMVMIKVGDCKRSEVICMTQSMSKEGHVSVWSMHENRLHKLKLWVQRPAHHRQLPNAGAAVPSKPSEQTVQLMSDSSFKFHPMRAVQNAVASSAYPKWCVVCSERWMTNVWFICFTGYSLHQAAVDGAQLICGTLRILLVSGLKTHFSKLYLWVKHVTRTVTGPLLHANLDLCCMMTCPRKHHVLYSVQISAINNMWGHLSTKHICGEI